MNSTELYHYGVKGMKWGVRRYQNYDGSYTKKGLERFRKAESDYDLAKVHKDKVTQAYKSGNATKQEYGAAKIALKSAKREMNNSYKKLKTDNRADKGKELYKQGKTITSNKYKNIGAQIGISVGSTVAKQLVNNTFGNTKVGQISSRAISIGSVATKAVIAGKFMTENRNLRAYYAH